MKKLLYLFLLTSISLVFIRCENIKDWSDVTDNIPPGKISNPVVENLNGAVRITYTLPSDDDLLGVKAVFSLSEELKDQKAFSSAFRDTIDLDGFADTSERIVKLFTIDKSKNESEPVEVIIKPLTPAVNIIRQSLSVNETFGGVYVTWQNPGKADIGISLFNEDSTGQMTHNYTYFSNFEEDSYSFRGMGNTKTKFQIQIQDNWERSTYPLDTVLTPLYDAYISQTDKFDALLMLQYAHSNNAEYRGDVPLSAQHPSQNWAAMFDRDIWSMFNTGNQGNPLSQYTEKDKDGDIHVKPIYWIMDLGRVCMINRMKFWMWGTRTLMMCAPKHFKIWARLEEPPKVDVKDGKLNNLAYWTSWPEVGGTDEWKNDWDCVADCWNIPPSGQTDEMLISQEDQDWAMANGFEHDFFQQFTQTPYRYLRFEMIELWGTTSTFVQVGDMEFWGQEVLE